MNDILSDDLYVSEDEIRILKSVIGTTRYAVMQKNDDFLLVRRLVDKGLLYEGEKLTGRTSFYHTTALGERLVKTALANKKLVGIDAQKETGRFRSLPRRNAYTSPKVKSQPIKEIELLLAAYRKQMVEGWAERILSI